MDNKYNTVICKNTYFYSNEKVEEKHEEYIDSVVDLLLEINEGFKNASSIEEKKKILDKTLLHGEQGLKAILSLSGFSKETFRRLITLVRISDDTELNEFMYKDKWKTDTLVKRNTIDENDLSEWSDTKILTQIKKDKYFRMGIVNLFFDGSTNPFILRSLPLFEAKKLGIDRLSFDTRSLLNTLVCYKEKGARSANGDFNPERVIELHLKSLGITFEKGDLKELVENEFDKKERWI